MTTKKRVKKYNRVEAERKNNERALKGTVVSYFVNDVHTERNINLTTLDGRRLHVTPKINQAITTFRYLWQVYLCAGCFNSKGERELKVEPLVFTQPYLQSELVGFLNEKHNALFENLRAKNVRISWGGWVAKPSGKELSDEEIYTIFEKQGAWEGE